MIVHEAVVHGRRSTVVRSISGMVGEDRTTPEVRRPRMRSGDEERRWIGRAEPVEAEEVSGRTPGDNCLFTEIEQTDRQVLLRALGLTGGSETGGAEGLERACGHAAPQAPLAQAAGERLIPGDDPILLGGHRRDGSIGRAHAAESGEEVVTEILTASTQASERAELARIPCRGRRRPAGYRLQRLWPKR